MRRNVSPSVTIVTSSVPVGCNVTPALAVNDPLAIVASPIVSPLFIVVSPPVSPMVIVFAAPPIANVSTLVLKILAVLVVEVISADVGPLTARSPEITPLLLIVVVPDDAPIETVVAFVARLSAVRVASVKISPVTAVVVIAPPLTARSPPNVVVPVPRNSYAGFVVVLPNVIFCWPVRVSTTK